MVFGNINVPISFEIVVLLLLIGAAVKHLEVFNKVVNTYIPVILIVIGIVVALLTNITTLPDSLVETLINGLASAIVAVGIHSSGKNIFANGVFVDFFVKKNLNEDTSSENDEEKRE